MKHVFLRAYLYFELIQQFGDVPYIEKSLALDEMEGITRTPREEVYKKVMEDFDYAIEKLPVQWPSDKYGRITKRCRPMQ